MYIHILEKILNLNFHYELSKTSLIKLCSFIFWGWSYVWCAQNAPKEQSPEWSSRVITLVHGSVATVAGLWQCEVFNISRSTLTAKITPAHYALMLWSWGYFAFDLLWCLIHSYDSYVILVHHLTALIGVNIYTCKDYTGCTFSCTLALLEITNPLLQARWLLRSSGYGTSLPFYIIELAYLMMFIFLRGPVCTYLIIKILYSDILDLDEKLVSLALYVVSLVLICEILSYVTYKYKHKIESFKEFANEVGLILNDIQ